MAIAKIINQFIAPVISKTLAPTGFSRDADGSWRRVTGNVLGCVEVQRRLDDSSFCINLGSHFDFLPINAGSSAPSNLRALREPQCELRTRLIRDGHDTWWSHPEDADEISQLLSTRGLDFLNSCLDIRASLGAIAPEDIDGDTAIALTAHITSGRRRLLLARVHEHLGNYEWAMQIAESTLAQNPRSGVKVQLQRLRDRLRHLP